MKEIRIHARAGQGAITTAMILGEAVFREGRYALAFPNFGAARMGAPMNAFVRIDNKPIRLRSQVYEPDYIIVVDPTLMLGFDVFNGMRQGGVAVINKREDVPVPAIKGVRIIAVPANDIAQEIMGRPLGNTVLLGAFAGATGEIKLRSLEEAVKRYFPGEVGKKNAQAANAGFEAVSKQISRQKA